MKTSFDSARMRRRQVQCFWAGIATAVAVASYRIYVTFSAFASQDAGSPVSMTETWTTNGFMVWSLTLFVLAWLFWRDTRRRQDELTTVVRSILPDVLLVTDVEGSIRLCNPATESMFGYTPAELLDRSIHDIVAERSATGAEREIYDRMHRSGHDIRPGIGIRKDGTRFPVDITTAQLIEQSGSVILIRDISERSQVEQLRENLNHILVHDLRNPLFGIGLSLNMVESLCSDLPAEARESLKLALEFTADVGEMLRCLTDVTQLESGEWRLRPLESDLGDLTDKALSTLASAIQRKRHTVVWSPAPAPIRCDPQLIQGVVLNLLRNAVDATPSGGRIEIRFEPKAKTFRVSIQDNGPGVPPEFQAFIFQKFGQMPEGRKIKRRASGLGLVFAKLAVEAHGGTIGVESPAHGAEPGATDAGSTFWFELPMA